MAIARMILTASGCVLALSGCSPESETSEDIQKIERSELHQLGASCTGDYFSFEDGNFVLVKKNEKTIVQKDIKLSDLGSHRLTMTAPYGNASLVSAFVLSHDNTTAKFDGLKAVPDLTPEQLDNAKLPRDFIAKMDAEMRKVCPTLVLCPRKTS